MLTLTDEEREQYLSAGVPLGKWGKLTRDDQDFLLSEWARRRPAVAARERGPLATAAEWAALPEEQRLAIVREHGFRRRPDGAPAAPVVPTTPAATPATASPTETVEQRRSRARREEAEADAIEASGKIPDEPATPAEALAWARAKRKELGLPTARAADPPQDDDGVERLRKHDPEIREFERAFERAKAAGRARDPITGKTVSERRRLWR